MTTIESRLAAVERQLRFHRLVIAGLLVGLVALVGYGATEGVPAEIRARNFVAVDEGGTPRAVMGALGAGGAFLIFNKERKAIVSVNPDANGGGKITLSNNLGVEGVTLGGMGSLGGGGVVEVYNTNNQVVVGVVANANGDGLLGVNRNGGGYGVLLSAMNVKGGGGAVVVFNKTGDAVVNAVADEYGIGYVGAFDRQGKGRTLTPR